MRQRLLPVLERARRLERRFKLVILALTVVGIVGLVGGSTPGRYAVARLANRARWGVLRLIGQASGREEIEAEVRLRAPRGSSGRPRSIETTSGTKPNPNGGASSKRPGWRPGMPTSAGPTSTAR